MMEVTITINVPGLMELANALNGLASVKKGIQPEPAVSAPVNQPVSTLPSAPIQQTVPVKVPTTPLATPQAATQVPQAAPIPQPVPTSTVSYMADDLARAAMTLMDAGKQPQLIQLLNSFGVDSLPALAPEQYGPFATALRGMGAQI